jgi:hypothetical protein
MSDFEQSQNFEAKLTRALEQRPEVAVPAEFAARVRAALPAQMPVRARGTVRVSRTAAMVSGVVLLVAMCWLAPHSSASFRSAAFDMELVLLAELAGVVVWMGMRRDA